MNSFSILNVLSDLSAAADEIIIEKESDLKFPKLQEWVSLLRTKAVKIIESENATSDSSQSEEIPSLMSYLKGQNKKVSRGSLALPGKVIHVHQKGRKSSVNTKYISLGRRSLLQKLKSSKVIVDGEQTEKNDSGSVSSLQREEILQENINPSVEGKSTDSSKGKGKADKNIKFEKLKIAKNSSLLLSNTKSSVGANGFSNLKESSAMRAKIETKQEKAIENRNIILALRHQRMEQNKRIREEKVEKTLEKRMKLEKEKISKFKEMRNARERGESSIKKATQKEKVVTKNIKQTENETVMKSKEKKPVFTSATRLQMNSKKAGSLKSKEMKETSQSIKSIPSQPPKLMENKSGNPIAKLNTTFLIAHTGEREEASASTSNKGNTLKDVSVYSPGTHKKFKAAPKTVKSLVEEEKLISTPVAKKGVQSYVLTPDRSSFVSYDISEIHSDSEEEEQSINSKPVPSWATGVRLRNALLQQHLHPIDTDELFGNFFETPDLNMIMGVMKKRYNKRTSSAVWNSSFD